MFRAILVITLIHRVTGLVGYDCVGPSLNITTISLNDVGECNIPMIEPITSPVYVQLLQVSEFSYTEVKQCKIEIDRTIMYCGMYSHNSLVNNGRQTYLQDIDETGCQKLQATGMILLSFNGQIVGIRKNSTTSRGITLAGSIKNDGACQGSQYSDPFGNWDNVVVQASVKITISNYVAAVDLKNNKIILRSGTHCHLSEGTCMDIEGNSVFWKTEPSDTCQFNRYDVLFEGIATKLVDPRNTSGTPDVYSLTTQETTFALAAKSEKHICGFALIRTEHPKLYILETQEGKTFAKRSPISVNNLDIFAYVNSKFIYVEKHIKTQMQNLYKDVILQRCNLERQILQNAINTATTFPEKFAKTVMKSPGFMAVIAGEVAHIVKCLAVEVQLRKTLECYNELPVSHKNQSRYLSSVSRILLKAGTQIDCDPILPAQYLIDGNWYRFSPHPIPVQKPHQLSPVTQPTWTYNPIGNLASSGIYTDQEISDLRDRIMFPAERPALLNTIARGSAGYPIPPGSISLRNLLDNETINELTEGAVKKLWHGFEKFGIISAGFFAIAMIFSLIKAAVDICIQGYTLHTLYGWSFALIGAIWNSITHLLITRKYKTEINLNKELNKAFNNEPGVELINVTSPEDPVEPSPAPRLSGVDPVLLERLAVGPRRV